MSWQAFQLNEDETMLRESVFRFELEDLGLSYIEDYQTLMDEADQFFFDSKGFIKESGGKKTGIHQMLI